RRYLWQGAQGAGAHLYGGATSAHESEAWLMTAHDQTPSATARTGVSAAMALAPEAIVRALNGLPGAHEWQVKLLCDDETQLYLIGERPESRRRVTNIRARVTLHHDHSPRTEEIGALARGTATITLLPEDFADPAQMAARLREGVAMAGLTDNLPFRLP